METIADLLAKHFPEPEDGTDGEDGEDGGPGPPGRGIAGAALDSDNNLIIVYTDETVENVGQINVPESTFNVGDFTDADIKALQARFDPIYPQWIDEKGNVVEMIQGGVRPGQTMPLRVKFILEQLKRANGSNTSN